MSFYPAEVVAVDASATTVQIKATGKKIILSHTAHNAVPAAARHVGVSGFISFPKVPPVFTLESHPAESAVAA